MARKGNQQRNSLDRHSSNQKVQISDSCGGPLAEETENINRGVEVNGVGVPIGNKIDNPAVDRTNKKKVLNNEKKSNKKSRKAPVKEQPVPDKVPDSEQSVTESGNLRPREDVQDPSAFDVSQLRGSDRTSLGSDQGSVGSKDGLGCSQNGLSTEDVMEGSGPFDTMVSKYLGASALSILKAACGWLESKKPLFTTLTAILFGVGDYIRLKSEQAYPIIWKWLGHFGNLILLISMVWLDCSLRGFVSFMRLGTTSFFVVFWCGILSLIAMVGISKFLLIMGVATLVAFFVGLMLAALVVAILATVFLWMYGSFWTTGLVTLLGGLGFKMHYERFALLSTTIYSIYCAKTYVGWLGLFLGLNLSFISSDILIHFLQRNMNDHSRSSRPHEETAGWKNQPGSFSSDPMHASSETFGRSVDRDSGVPSTGGDDAELTSGDEIVRLLNSTDHYAALGLLRYETVDLSLLKREYRRKAMLVHPDKNMGNEKAAEAFKKLQNAYEVLLDSLKRKAYDDELRREELLNWFRRSQNISLQNGKTGLFASGFSHSTEDLQGDSRRIACKKCGSFHIWIHTSRSKSKARWCQDCNDFHQAKDGDGWVEQSSHPFFFGLLQKPSVRNTLGWGLFTSDMDIDHVVHTPTDDTAVGHNSGNLVGDDGDHDDYGDAEESSGSCSVVD
ncbi:hypothetical protein IFM89_015310 [Coptis chinensis]|uniref:J domain-containing protein n=1 Tax=Coptis chinensis TaxID=261450 RepID=A0A835IQA0_9MAGN|nr:hypothetical protein IFM89_015310 [Coptis chinensis]